MTKNILLLGASGTAGSGIRKALLSQTDAHLTLVSRHANQLTPNPKREKLAQLDVHDHDALIKAMKGQDIVFSALSSEGDPDELARLAQDVINAMQELHLKRLIFMVAMGIYNEIPASVGAQDNVNNNPAQIHNLRAAKVIEASSLDYTLLRPGFLIPGPDSVVITHRGENVSGNTTTISSVGSVAVQLVTGNLHASRDSLGLNQPTTK